MRWPRWANHLYAVWFDYFWLVCPVCDRMFGGHECRGGFVFKGRDVKWATCWRCPEHPEVVYNRVL